MKIQCSCGTKYAFDVTPEMAQNPVQLVCSNCGTDISSYVNELIRQELQATVPISVEPEPGPEAAPAPAAPAGLRMRVHTAPKETESAAAPAEMPVCLKHPPQRTTHKCRICQKPICPECMAMFGYVCSPHCRAKAEANGVTLPVYAVQRAVVKARHWRKVGLAMAGVGVLVAALLGAWVWYEFVGCLPRPYLSVRFPERARSGESAFCANNQIVFLHGATLARYDTKQNKQVWSHEVVDKKEAALERGNLSAEKLASYLVWLAEDYRLKVNGQNVWVVTPGKLTRYDWQTGEPKQEIPLTGGSEAVLQDNEVLVIGNQPGSRVITHISLANGEKRVEEVNEPKLAGRAHPSALATTKNVRSRSLAGLPVRVPGQNSAAPLDPGQVAAQVQSLSTPARIALPAVLASTMAQERLMTEINEQDGAQPALEKNSAPTEDYSLIPLKDGCLQFSVRLLERRTVTRTAMKERSGKSALDNVRADDAEAVANELLNDMQRDRGGDKVTEDQSRYWVTLRRADDKVKAEWVGEVVGPPGLIPLETVNVLAAGNVIRVFDKENRKIWEQALTFNVPLTSFASDGGYSFGAGPCVERGEILYVVDQGVLTAFDLANGNARWRLPTVGVTGMFFDDSGMIYVNTTTASHDTIKYSRQIDVSAKVDSVVLKIDPRSGKTLWSAKPNGFINYISGKYIYVVTSYAGDFDENGEPYGIETGFEKSAYLNIKRLNPKDGKVIWSYAQKRSPLDVRFNQNTIQLVFRKEVQALKFWTF